jgi:protoporphyrinogen oxidase
MMDRFLPYPFQNNIGYLPREVALECILGLVEAQKHPEAIQNATNFNDLIDAQFGAGIAKYFMKPYNFKVWAHPISHMSRSWLGERVAMPSVERILGNVLLDRPDKGWGPNNKFKYPLRGGTGALYEAFRPYIQDRLHLNKSAVCIDHHAKKITFDDGETVEYDLLLSTMPLDLLVNHLADAPEYVQRSTRGLHHSSGFIVGIGVNRAIESSKCWMYFPEPSALFYRVTYLSNYSPYMTPSAEHTLFLTETSYSVHKPEDKTTLVDQVVQGLLNTKLLHPSDLPLIQSTYLIDVDYSYPVPTIDRDTALNVIQGYLSHFDILSRGRFGAWQYEIGNMDHSVMQGVEVVNKWLLGEPEVTWKDLSGIKAPTVVVQEERHALNAVSGKGSVEARGYPFSLPQPLPNASSHVAANNSQAPV